jgi:hypothetical protein
MTLPKVPLSELQPRAYYWAVPVCLPSNETDGSAYEPLLVRVVQGHPSGLRVQLFGITEPFLLDRFRDFEGPITYR